MLVNVHRKKTPNQGDLASAPLRYFHQSKPPIYIDILDCEQPSNRIKAYLDDATYIIVGGGGLLENNKFIKALNFIKESYGAKTVLWGVGSNSPHLQADRYPISNLMAAGLRDYEETDSGLWVPCASCLSPLFPKIIQERKKNYIGGIGILENNSGDKIHAISSCGQENIRRFGNKKVSLAEMAGFIASCDLLITSSYHAAYWATLLCIPVIAIPTSSKFHKFKYKVPLAKFNNWPDSKNLAITHPTALEDCISANIKFKNSLPLELSSLNLLT